MVPFNWHAGCTLPIMSPNVEHREFDGTLCRFRRTMVLADESDTAMDVARKLREHRVGCVVVTTKDLRPIGILTDRDLALRVVAEGTDSRVVRVSEIVTSAPLVLRDDDDVASAVACMRDHGIRRLPIVDNAGRVVGMVTSDDLMMELGRDMGALSAGREASTDSNESR